MLQYADYMAATLQRQAGASEPRNGDLKDKLKDIVASFDREDAVAAENRDDSSMVCESFVWEDMRVPSAIRIFSRETSPIIFNHPNGVEFQDSNVTENDALNDNENDLGLPETYELQDIQPSVHPLALPRSVRMSNLYLASSPRFLRQAFLRITASMENEEPFANEPFYDDPVDTIGATASESAPTLVEDGYENPDLLYSDRNLSMAGLARTSLSLDETNTTMHGEPSYANVPVSGLSSTYL